MNRLPLKFGFSLALLTACLLGGQARAGYVSAFDLRSPSFSVTDRFALGTSPGQVAFFGLSPGDQHDPQVLPDREEQDPSPLRWQQLGLRSPTSGDGSAGSSGSGPNGPSNTYASLHSAAGVPQPPLMGRLSAEDTVRPAEPFLSGLFRPPRASR